MNWEGKPKFAFNNPSIFLVVLVFVIIIGGAYYFKNSYTPSPVLTNSEEQLIGQWEGAKRDDDIAVILVINEDKTFGMFEDYYGLEGYPRDPVKYSGQWNVDEYGDETYLELDYDQQIPTARILLNSSPPQESLSPLVFMLHGALMEKQTNEV